MKRSMLRSKLLIKQNANCIVQDCPYDPGTRDKDFHIHRIVPGSQGGEYNLDNCVLVCIHHHKGIELLSRDEIMEQVCGTHDQRWIREYKDSKRRNKMRMELREEIRRRRPPLCPIHNVERERCPARYCREPRPMHNPRPMLSAIITRIHNQRGLTGK